MISVPLAPITRYSLLFWMVTVLHVAFFSRSTCVPALTVSKAGEGEVGRNSESPPATLLY